MLRLRSANANAPGDTSTETESNNFTVNLILAPPPCPNIGANGRTLILCTANVLQDAHTDAAAPGAGPE